MQMPAWRAGALLVLAVLSFEARSFAESSSYELPRGFVENRGQWDARAAFAAQGFYGSSWVSRDGRLRHVFHRAQGCAARNSVPDGEGRGDCQRSAWVVEERLLGASMPDSPRLVDPLPVEFNYFLGRDRMRHVRGVRAHRALELGEVYPGIALRLEAHSRSLEKIFALAPGARVEDIRIEVAGAESLAVADDGGLLWRTGLGEVRLSPPVAWQEGPAGREPVAVAYRVEEGSRYGFELGPFDASRAVYIDPLIQSTYAGGSGLDAFFAVAFDPLSGDVFAAGRTFSNDFPQTVGGAQGAYAGGGDGVILRIRPSLDNQPYGGFVQATYIGGSGGDEIRALAVANGFLYAAGITTSSDLPNATGALGSYQGGAADAFLLRINPSLTSGLIVSYFGGAQGDEAHGLTVGAAGIFLGGETSSSTLPATGGAAFPMLAGSGPDGFVARFSPDLSSIVRSTYYGGSAFERVNGLSIQPVSGRVGVVGATMSNNLPTTAGVYQPGPSGVGDSGEAFVALFSDDLASLFAGSYLGGLSNTLPDVAYAIAFSVTGEVFVAGGASNGFDDTTAGTVQPGFAGGAWPDAFVVRLNPTLSTLIAGTMLGGNNDERVNAVAVYPGHSEIVVGGLTFSSNFLAHAGVSGVTAGFQGASLGSYDAFVVRLDFGLSTARYSYHGGVSGDDFAYGVGVHPFSGEIYWAGVTNSSDLLGRVGGAQGAISGGGGDGFLARASNDLSGGPANPDLAAHSIVSPATVVTPGHTAGGGTFRCRNVGNAAVFRADCIATPSAGAITATTCLTPGPPLPTFTPGTPYPAIGPFVSGPLLGAPAPEMVCNFDYQAPGAPGGGDEPTQQVTFTLTAAAANDGNAGNNTLLSAPIDVLDALDDSVSLPANATGQTFNVSANDQLGTTTFGSGPLPPGVTYLLDAGSTCANSAINSGTGVATFDVPASGSCVVNYRVCFAAACDFAILTVTAAGGADVEVTGAPIPLTVGPGQTLPSGAYTCTNIGTAPANNVSCSHTLSAGTTVSLSCSPTPPVATLAPGDQVRCDWTFQAPGAQGGADEPAQQMTVTYSTSAQNDTNPGNNTRLFTADVLDALNDAVSVPWLTAGHTSDVRSNDQLGAGAVPGAANYTLLAATCPNATLTSAGLAGFDAPTVPPGTCTLSYRVTLGAPPGFVAQDEAVLTVTALFPDMQANVPTVPSAAAPGGSEPLTFGCTNAGTAAAAQATCAVTVVDCVSSAPVGTVSGVTCTPTPPVGSLGVGASISCTGTFQAPGAVGGTAIGAGPNLCARVTAGSSPTDPVAANNQQQAAFVLVDAVSESITAIGAGSFNVAANDFNGAGAVSGATYALVAGPGTTCPTPAVTPTGVASFGAVTGSCTITYRVCVDGRCDEAVLEITGLPPPRPVPMLGLLGLAVAALGVLMLARRRKLAR